MFCLKMYKNFVFLLLVAIFLLPHRCIASQRTDQEMVTRYGRQYSQTLCALCHAVVESEWRHENKTYEFSYKHKAGCYVEPASDKMKRDIDQSMHFANKLSTKVDKPLFDVDNLLRNKDILSPHPKLGDILLSRLSEMKLDLLQVEPTLLRLNEITTDPTALKDTTDE